MNKIRLYRWKKYLKIATSIFGILMAIAAILFFQCAIGYGNESNPVEELENIDAGWTIVENGVVHENINITEYKTDGKLRAGDTVTLCRNLPEDWEYNRAVLQFQSHKSSVNVWVDGELVRSYGQDRYEKKQVLGSGYHFVNLRTAMKGKQVVIEYKIAEDSAFKRLDSIYITDAEYVNYNILEKYRLPFLIGIFLVILGIVLLAGGSILAFKNYEFMKCAYVGMLAICVGGWSICYYRLLQLFFIPIYVSCLVEYMALYLGVIPLLMYFGDYVKNVKKPLLYRVYRILLTIQMVYTTFVIFAAILIDERLVTRCLGFEQILMASVVIFFIALCVSSCKDKENRGYNRSSLIGFVAFLLLMVSDMVVYILKKMFGIMVPEVAGAACIGGLVFIAVLLIALGSNISKRLKKIAEQEVLYRMAYTDDLTQVYNRRFCEECLEKVSKGSAPFTIYNFDLNYLKKTNDTLGHSMGDKLIAGFAVILKKTFEDVGVIGRMGGDEFIVIVDEAADFDAKKYIDRLNNSIKEANHKEKQFQYSVAIGYAGSCDFPLDSDKIDARKVYTLADNRMYENKRTFRGTR